MNISSVPPKKITPRQQQVAMLKALGMPNQMIAEQTGYTQVRVSVLLSDARLAAMVVAYQEQHATSVFTDQAARLNNELAPTIDKILQHRDGEDPTASLRACDMIMARAMPAVKASVEDRTVRIILEKHEITRIAQADAEMEIVNAEVSHENS